MNKYEKAIEVFTHFFTHRSMYLSKNDNFYEVTAFLYGYGEATGVLKGFNTWIVLNTSINSYYNSVFQKMIIVLTNRRIGIYNEQHEYNYCPAYNNHYIELLFDLLLKYLNSQKVAE